MPLTSFEGNVPLSGGGLSGTVNFAVFQLPDPIVGTLLGKLAFVPGTSSPTFDTMAKFVYFYQPTTSPSSSGAVTKFIQNFGGPPSPTSWGYFQNQLFTINCPGPSCQDVNATHALPGGTTPGFDAFKVADAGINPAAASGMTCAAQPSTNAVHLSAPNVLTDYCNNLLAGSTSSVMAFTSNLPPTTVPTALQFGMTTIGGNDPGPTPEPASLLLSAVGLATLAGARARGRVRLLALR
jgi:hypothetical protein